MQTVTARDGQIILGRLPEQADTGTLLTGSIPSILLSVRACSSPIPLILEALWASAGVQDGEAGMIPGILFTDHMLTDGAAAILITDITGFTLPGATILTTLHGVMTITAGTACATLITGTRPFT